MIVNSYGAAEQLREIFAACVTRGHRHYAKWNRHCQIVGNQAECS